jgi:hypothetical protein
MSFGLVSSPPSQVFTVPYVGNGTGNSNKVPVPFKPLIIFVVNTDGLIPYGDSVYLGGGPRAAGGDNVSYLENGGDFRGDYITDGVPSYFTDTTIDIGLIEAKGAFEYQLFNQSGLHYILTGIGKSPV